jgi:hypothetical protein
MLLVFPLLLTCARAFTSPSVTRSRTFLHQSTQQDNDDSSVQWELFQRHHLGSWKGVWTTYDYISDVIDETVASVELDYDADTIQHAHKVVVGAKRSDCETCFDSMDVKTIPIATYTPGNLRKSRLASCSMVNGPTLLRSGSMATELVLSHGDGRVRVVFQHAPVWAKGVEPGSCPPQGLKLFRTMISREARRATAPTAETEEASPPTEGNPVFFRPVPPFDWHKKWSGTSWTWGPQSGNRGWSLEDLDEPDAWQGAAPVERWNLRLPGGVFVQAPRVVTDMETELFRLAWLPDSDNLLRVECGILALQPMLLDDDTLAGFEPPSMSSLRCDVLRKVGELDGKPMFAQDPAEPEGEEPDSDLEAPRDWQ